MPSAGPEFEESWSVVQLRLDSRPAIPLYPIPTPHQGVTLKDSFWEKLSTTENCHQVNLSGCLFVTDEFVNHLVRIIEPKSYLQVGIVLLSFSISCVTILDLDDNDEPPIPILIIIV